MLLFIPELLSKDYASIKMKLFIICVAWILVLVSMLIDLHYGIRKAKKIGEHTTSEGFRRTVTKFKDYYTVLTFALIADILISPFTYYLPGILSFTSVVSIIAALGLVLTEFKSIREKADQKLRRRIDKSFIDIGVLYQKLKDDGLIEKIIESAKEKDNENINNATTDSPA